MRSGLLGFLFIVSMLVFGGCGGPPLEPVALPDLERLDPQGRAQIRSAFDTLQTMAGGSPPPRQLAVAYGAMGQLLHAYDFEEAAAAYYRNARQLDPEDFRWPYLLGLQALHANTLESARQNLAQALERLEQDPAAAPQQQVAAWYWLAQVEHRLQHLPEARAALDQALALNPRAGAVWLARGRVLLEAGDAEAALPALEQALALLQGAARPPIYHSLGLAHRALGQADQARHYLEQAGQSQVTIQVHDPLWRATQARSRSPGALNRRANRAYGAGQYQEAINLYRQSLALNPDDYITQNNLGGVLLRLGRHHEAAGYFRAALRLKPDFAHGYRALAEIARHNGDADAALAQLRHAETLAPQDREVLLDLGELLLQQGEHEAARSYFEAVLAIDPGQPRAIRGRAAAGKAAARL